MATVFRIISYLRNYPLLAGAQLLCAVLMTLLVIVFPEVTSRITGEVIPNREMERLIPMCLLALGAFLATNLFNALRIVLNNTFEQSVIFDIRSDLYSKIQKLPMQWFDNKRTGDVMTRVTEDVTAMERVLIDGIEQGVVAFLQVLAVGAWLFFKDPQLAAIAMIPMPILAFGAWAYARNAPSRHRAVRESTSSLNSLLHDNIDGIQQIKSFTRERAEHAHFDESSQILRKATLQLMKIWAIYSPSMEMLRNLGYVLVIGFGAYAIIDAPDSESLNDRIGTLTGFLVALGLFYEPISRLNGLNQILQGSRAAADRVFEIMDAEEETHLKEGEILSEPIRGEVRIEGLSFSYGDGINTLDDVSMLARPGEMIALVGHTGAGKSTIINLLTRFYEATGGSISIDGTDIATVRKSSLRGALGYVTQESFLFNGTVRENLELAAPEANDATMWTALEASNAAAFVRELPKQLDTPVGERGVKLSVGEKQRLAIARVILKNPPILLLDEATASVDNETEELIQQALEKLMEERTSFVIAHRLSTVRNADRIYVLEKGRVVESGTHEELVSKPNGAYSSLSQRGLLDH
ncbi:MAG: ABC transporter ATP-binding protein [Verrucomicrobiota bacterium]